ncbi:hypothetical protein FRC01_002822 [Tulasnella sp. 417]|nr:hypothetical protein FRC01_002822 [Tulasnella sp. 417]
MSPTAQPDGNTSKTAKAVSPPAGNPNASGSSGASGRKPILVNEYRGKRTLVLIMIGYPNRDDKYATGENGKEKTVLELLELKSVPNDLDLLLARHRCIGDESQRVFICSDFPHKHESPNVSVRGASKTEILKCVVEASRAMVGVVPANGVRDLGHAFLWSLLISPAAATFKDGRSTHEDDESKAAKTKEAKATEAETKEVDTKDEAKEDNAKEEEAKRAEPPHLVSSDRKTISGKEFEMALYQGLERNGLRRTTIILSCDACHIASFFNRVLVLPHLYRAEALGGLKKEHPGEARFGQSQIIFLASTRFDQTALPLKKEKEYGAATWLTTQYLEGAAL